MADKYTVVQSEGYQARVEPESTKGEHHIIFDDVTGDGDTGKADVRGFADGVCHVRLGNASANKVSLEFQGSIIDDPTIDDHWFNMDESNTIHKQDQSSVSEAYPFEVGVKWIRVRVSNMSGETIFIKLMIHRDS